MTPLTTLGVIFLGIIIAALITLMILGGWLLYVAILATLNEKR